MPEHQLRPEYPWVTVPVPESGSPGVQSAGDMAGSKEFGFGHSKLEVPMNHLNQGWQIFPFKEVNEQPWPGGSVGWSIIPYTKSLWVRSLVRAHA